MLRISSCTMTVLPVPAPPNSPIFEPLANVQIRSTTLIPVSRISTLACCSETGGAGRGIGRLVTPSGGGSSFIGLAPHDVEHAAQPLHAHGDRDGVARRMHWIAASEAVGRVHCDRADGVVPDRAFDLQHDHAAVLRLDLERLEQLGLLARRKLHVDHGADDLADVAVFRVFLLGLRCVFGFRHRLLPLQLDARIASAPLTISISSVVIPAWRTLFANRVSASIRSPAALVAFCIAIILAEYSLALFSSTA